MIEHKIIVAGIGPGAEDFISPAALDAVKSAPVLVGGRRALAQFASPAQRTFPVTADIPAALDFIRTALESSDVTVMVSGDPGYYSMLDTLRREFDVDRLEVIPSISAIQLAFARAKRPWHDATLLSFHGRRPDDRDLYYAPRRVLGLLTDAKFNSRSIARLLLELGWAPSAAMTICARLSYSDESIVETTLEEAASDEAVKHCVLIVGGNDDD